MATPMNIKQLLVLKNWRRPKPHNLVELDLEDMVRILEEARQAGFEQGLQQSKNHIGCKVCGVDVTQPRGYCCPHQQCPGRIT